MIPRVGLFGMALLLVSVTLGVHDVRAADIDEIAKLLASDGSLQDRYGVSVSLDGDVALVGAYKDDGNDEDSGSAYVYRFDGMSWVEEQKLTASDAAEFDEFGYSVAVSGDVALIGAYMDDDNGSQSGSVYTYRFDGSTWVEEQKLVMAAPGGLYRFGTSVSVQGDLALIGAPYDNEGGMFDTGSAFVYRFNGSNWVEEQRLVASDPASSAAFGISVSLDGDVALIGAYLDDDNGVESGSAYVFRFDGASWVEEQKLIASDGTPGDRFGTSVALDGDAALIGSPYDDENGFQSGSTYAFRFDGSTWAEEEKIVPGDTDSLFRVGFSVSLDGDAALIGAPVRNGGVGATYVYAFDGSSWREEQTLTASDGSAGDQFGYSVSMDGDAALIAAVYGDGTGTDTGAAYVFLEDSLVGTVNAANGSVFNVLFIEGSSGGPDRTVEVAEGDFITVTLLKPLMGGSGKFVLHGNVGTPNFRTQTLLPSGIGLGSFPFLTSQGASPIIVANSIGRENKLGASQFFGTPVEDPDPAPTKIVYPDLPLGTCLTFQAIIIDPGSVSAMGASTTNGVIFKVLP